MIDVAPAISLEACEWEFTFRFANRGPIFELPRHTWGHDRAPQRFEAYHLRATYRLGLSSFTITGPRIRLDGIAYASWEWLGLDWCKLGGTGTTWMPKRYPQNQSRTHNITPPAWAAELVERNYPEALR